MKVKLNETQSCRLDFTHLNGKPASLFVQRNPLTGDWLQTHGLDGKHSSYYSDKAGAISLINKIITKTAKENLPCKVKIENHS